jgi:hypothetical protein
MSVVIREVLLDALKPRELSIIELSKALGSVDGVDEVSVIVSEVDSNTETIKITIKGTNIEYEVISELLEKYAVSLRGVDEVHVAKADLDFLAK